MSIHATAEIGQYDEMNAASIKSYVYILCNKCRNVVYAGSTDDLKRRVYFHKKRLIPGFTKKYSVDQLVYFELFDRGVEARGRKKQIKGYRREKKNSLIRIMNPDWEDLYVSLR